MSKPTKFLEMKTSSSVILLLTYISLPIFLHFIISTNIPNIITNIEIYRSLYDINLMPTVQPLNAIDVILAQSQLGVVIMVERLHDRIRLCGVGETEGVAKFVR